MSSEIVEGYKFDSFELILRTQLLLRNGSRVRIERLPLQILLALLETPGMVVLREDLCARLWSEQNFLQADKGLQVAVAKLREALGEQAAVPRLVKTVHRVGYIFIGEVASIVAVEPAAGLALSDASAKAPDSALLVAPAGRVVLAESQAQNGEVSVNGTAGVRRVTLWRYLLGVTGLALLALTVWYYLQGAHRPLASAGEQVALGDISNFTNDPGLEGTLSTAMRIKFQESPFFAMVPDPAFLQQVKDAGASNTLQARLAACSKLRAHLLVDGEVQSLPADTQSPAYAVVLNVWRCGDGRKVATESASAKSKSSILPALDSVIDTLRKQMGESDSSIQRFNGPAAQITTSSLAALKAFNLGEEKRSQGFQTEAVFDFRLAIDLDPQFALAYARLGTVYYNNHERKLSQEYSRRAFELREHTSERERLYIASHYYSFVTGEIAQAIQAYSLWITLYPHDPGPATNLADEYLSIGYPEKALELARRAAEDEDNADGPAQSALMLSQLETGHLGVLKAFCQDPAHTHSHSTVFHFTCLRLAGIEDDGPRIQAELGWAKENPGGLGVIEFAALIAEDKGQVGLGNALFSQGRETAQKHHLVNFVAELDLDQADIDLNLGLSSEAHALAQDALKLAPNEPYLLGTAAFVLARAGDVALAESEARKAAAQAPADTILNDAVLPSVYAAIAMNRHDPELAISLLEKTRSLDGNMFMELAPAYYRGLALLEDKQTDAAVREFGWVIDHGRLCPESIYVNLAMLRLGQIQQISGRCEDAAKQYSKLNSAWRNADPLFLPLKEVQALKKTCTT